MGMEFYNLQIKKNGNDIRSKIKDFIESKGYSLTDKENAIGSFITMSFLFALIIYKRHQIYWKIEEFNIWYNYKKKLDKRRK